jgi:hypothetical protein
MNEMEKNGVLAINQNHFKKSLYLCSAFSASIYEIYSIDSKYIYHNNL